MFNIVYARRRPAIARTDAHEWPASTGQVVRVPGRQLSELKNG